MTEPTTQELLDTIDDMLGGCHAQIRGEEHGSVTRWLVRQARLRKLRKIVVAVQVSEAVYAAKEKELA